MNETINPGILSKSSKLQVMLPALQFYIFHSVSTKLFLLFFFFSFLCVFFLSSFFFLSLVTFLTEKPAGTRQTQEGNNPEASATPFSGEEMKPLNNVSGLTK